MHNVYQNEIGGKEQKQHGKRDDVGKLCCPIVEKYVFFAENTFPQRAHGKAGRDKQKILHPGNRVPAGSKKNSRSHKKSKRADADDASGYRHVLLMRKPDRCKLRDDGSCAYDKREPPRLNFG